MQSILLYILKIQTAHAAPMLRPQGSVQTGTIDKDIVMSSIQKAWFGTAGTGTNPGSTGILGWLLILTASAATLFIFWSGIQYIMSNGNADAQKNAKANLTNAFIGVIVVVLVYTISKFGVILGNTISNLL